MTEMDPAASVVELALVVAVAELALVTVVDEVALVVAVDEVVPDVLYDDRWLQTCSRCKIVVTKYHLLQCGMLWGKMANSPTCPSSKFLFVGLAYQHESIFDYQ